MPRVESEQRSFIVNKEQLQKPSRNVKRPFSLQQRGGQVFCQPIDKKTTHGNACENKPFSIFRSDGHIVLLKAAGYAGGCLLSVLRRRIGLNDIIKKYNLIKDISQLIVALIGINSVGVKGDERVYGHSLAIRAVQTVDFMTAKGYYFPEEVVNEITNALTKHKNIVRVLFDITPKPPATTEFE